MIFANPAIKLLAIAVLCVGAGIAVHAVEVEPVERAPVFFAKDLVPASLCSGERYRVRPIVQVVDFEYVFVVESDFGEYSVRGVEGLVNCLREIEAINHLESVSQSKAFATSFAKSLKHPIDITAGVASRPVSTVTGLPMGIGRYLSGKFYQVRKTSEKAIRRLKSKSKKKRNVVDAQPSDKETKLTKVRTSAGRLSQKHLGYEASKRSWSYTLGVNPYSDNERLQEALGRIAWASSIGGMAGGYVIPASNVVGYASKAQKLVWERPAHELEREGIRILRELSITKKGIRKFVECSSLSFSEKAAIVVLLNSMRGASGLEELLELTMAVESAQDANVIIRTLAILEKYVQTVARLDRLEIVEGVIVAYSINGYLVVPLAVDYLHWDPLVVDLLGSNAFAMRKREVWLSGKTSAIARDRLKTLHWHVFENRIETKISQ